MDTEKPPYLGLLNRISIAERNAGRYLAAWAEMTPDPELARALGLVAARETTHGEVFRQRIERLGFTVREREDPTLAERLRVYGDPAVSDADKIRHGRRHAAKISAAAAMRSHATPSGSTSAKRSTAKAGPR